MTVVTLRRWVLATAVDEGLSVVRRTFRTRDGLAACVAEEYEELFDEAFMPNMAYVGEKHWQLVVVGVSGWYGSVVDVEVDVAPDGALS